MLKYDHVINDLGSGPKIRYFYEPFAIIDADWQDQRARGSDYRQSFDLVSRRKFLEEIFKNGSEAGAKAKEKELLRYNRSSVIILFQTKGTVL